MADYYPLLAKAVAGLSNSTPETRRAIYERARAALIGQLRRMDPPVPDADVDREAEALEAAVTRLEAELAPAPETPAPQPSAPQPSTPQSSAPTGPAAEAGPRKPVATPGPAGRMSPAQAPDGGTARRSQSPDAPASAAPQEQQPLRSPPPFTVRREPRRPLAPGGNGGAPSDSGQKSSRPPTAPIAMGSTSIRNGVPALDAAPEPRAASDPGKTPEIRDAGVFEPVSDAPAAQEPAADELGLEAGSATGAEAVQSAAKIRSDAQRPFAPQPAREAAAPKRLWIVGAIVGLLVLLVAIAAFALRDRPEDLARLKAAQSPAATESGSAGKIVDRIGVSGAKPEALAPAGTDANAAADGKIVAKSAEEPAEAPVAVAHRAALLVEAPDEKSKVKTFLGSVVWRVDNVSNGSGEPLSVAVRADIEIPEEKLHAMMTFQKNFDASLPASHTMQITFMPEPDGPLADIKQISVPQMRREDTATGDALSGVPVPVTQNSFLVGLTRGGPESTNLDLLRSREWIDVPMLLSNGRIAKLTFEKGDSGQRALEDALASWQAQQ